MENIKFKHKCPKWIIAPDDVWRKPSKGFKEKHHTCECDLWRCGWLKSRIAKIRRRIIDNTYKRVWQDVIRLGKTLEVSLE